MNILQQKRRIHENLCDNRKFPEFESIEGGELDEILANLSEAFGLDPEELFLSLRSKRSKVDSLGIIEEHEFSLINFLTKNMIKIPHKKIFLNYGMGELFNLNVVDLENCFDCIYFPSADDIDIFDASWGWIVNIDSVSYTHLTLPTKA